MAQIKTPLGDADGLVLIDAATGLPYVASGGGGGGGGDATAANQVAGNAKLTDISSVLGTSADAEWTPGDPAGTTNALLKRVARESSNIAGFAQQALIDPLPAGTNNIGKVTPETPLVAHVYSQVGVIAINTNLLVIDCLNYNSLSIQITSMGTSGVITPAWSNNDIDYPAGVTQVSSSVGTPTLSFNAAGLWTTNVYARFLRLRLTTATTAGTTSINVQGFKTSIGQPVSQAVVASGAVSVPSITNAGTPAAPATPYILNSAATTNGALIASGTSGLHAFYSSNIGATAAFVKLYNKATAPTVGTDVPAMVLRVPAAVSGEPGVCTLPIGTQGFRFALGLGIAITGAVADNSTTAVAAGQVKVMLSRTV